MATSIKVSDFVINNLIIGDRKQLASGCQWFPLYYKDSENGKQPINIKMTTPLRMPFGGISTNNFDENSPVKTICQPSLDGMNDNESIMGFHSLLCAIDSYVKKYATENTHLLFKKKKMSEEVINEKYSPLLKYSKDKESGEINTKYAPTLRLKFIRKEDSNDKYTRVFNHHNKEIKPENIDEILGSSNIKNLKFGIALKGLWISGGNFGISMAATQIKVPLQPNTDECIFTDDEEGDEEDEDEDENGVDDDENENDYDDENDDDINEICNTSQIEIS